MVKFRNRETQDDHFCGLTFSIWCTWMQSIRQVNVISTSYTKVQIVSFSSELFLLNFKFSLLNPSKSSFMIMSLSNNIWPQAVQICVQKRKDTSCVCPMSVMKRCFIISHSLPFHFIHGVKFKRQIFLLLKGVVDIKSFLDFKFKSGNEPL